MFSPKNQTFTGEEGLSHVEKPITLLIVGGILVGVPLACLVCCKLFNKLKRWCRRMRRQSQRRATQSAHFNPSTGDVVLTTGTTEEENRGLSIIEEDVEPDEDDDVPTVEVQKTMYDF